MKNQDTKELRELLNHIADSYAGDYASVSHDLYKAIYYLHFLKEDELPPNEVLDICVALHWLGECFHKAHIEERKKNHPQANPR